ncbi:MAG: DUF4381 domain-containing protein [Gammaproteobacteria bacterium]|nr:DUF4381 domain-containing protein [Gammaproteobacteria bacterium]
MDANDPLAELRPYHLPEAVGWWPPAPGWWLLAFLLLALVAVVGYLYYRKQVALRPLRYAMQELERIAAAQANLAPDRLCAELSALLKRGALARFPQAEVAGLSGERWLAFLDANGGTSQFRNGPGRALIEMRYAGIGQVDRAELIALTRQWLAANLGPVVESRGEQHA